MKKRFGIKARLLGLAVLAAGAAATAPAMLPQTAVAAETVTAQNTSGMYEIVRNINIYYKNDDGSTTKAGTLPYIMKVSGRNMTVTFPEIKVEDLFQGGLAYWKPDRETLPAVTASYDNQPAEENIYLMKDKSSYVEESKTIKRTVKYYYEDTNGSRSNAGSYTDGITFKRPGYIDKNGNKVMDDWSGEYTFREIPVEQKEGYTASMQKVPSKKVTPADSDFTVEVVYYKRATKTETKKITRNINYIGRKTDGTTVSLGGATQSITLSREVYADGSGVARDWNKGALDEFTVKNIEGYTKQQNTVPRLEVTGSSKDTSVDVIYIQKKNGFMEENGKTCYYRDDKKLTGTHLINGYNYTFDSNGNLISEPFGLSFGRGARPFRIVKDGWYSIAAAANPNYSLDIIACKAANKANLQIYKTKNIVGQKFYIKSLGNNEYMIYTGTNNMKSVLDVAGKKTASGTNVWQYKIINHEAQVWRIVANADGSVTFLAKNSGLALDIQGAKYENWTNVRMYKVNYNKAQNFILNPTTAP